MLSLTDIAIVIRRCGHKAGQGCKILHARFARNYMKIPSKNPGYAPDLIDYLR